MTHLDEGALLTIRDGGPVDADARRHAETCVSCASALEDARVRSKVVARALDELTPEAPVELEAAKARVRRELDARREADRTAGGVLGWLPTGALGRAAALLLLASGVVYALPGSPIGDWVRRVTSPETVRPPAVRSSVNEGLELAVPDEGLHIALTSLEPGQRVEVGWTDGSRALVVAGPGSRYGVSSGRAEVDVEPGTVRIDLPRSGGPITIEADGRMILRSTDGSVDVLVDVVSRSADLIVFSTESG